MRVLLLGGTAEARAIAAALAGSAVEVISSLAGRVANPALPVGATRIGGFGGSEGLADYLRTEQIGAVIDATHPFATSITGNAATATSALGLPSLVVRRPEWDEPDGARWTRVPDIGAAAINVRDRGPGTIFLTTGRRDLAAFATDDAHHYLVRTVDPPSGPAPARLTLILARGPYRLEDERRLMIEHGAIALVTKNSGGPLTSAKLDAARELGIGVVMVDRPVLPPGVRTVPSVDAALAWVAQLLSG